MENWNVIRRIVTLKTILKYYKSSSYYVVKRDDIHRKKDIFRFVCIIFLLFRWLLCQQIYYTKLKTMRWSQVNTQVFRSFVNISKLIISFIRLKVNNLWSEFFSFLCCLPLIMTIYLSSNNSSYFSVGMAKNLKFPYFWNIPEFPT
jgi:hypothetical protein